VTENEGLTLEKYRNMQKKVANAKSYEERISLMPSWEKLAPGLIEFGPLPGEKNIGFLTSSSRIRRPIIDKSICIDCKNCTTFCPDGAIDFENIEVDYNYCQGCGICAEECPVNAIEIVPELRAVEGVEVEEKESVREGPLEYGF